MLRDVLHRKIVGGEAPREAAERERDQHELRTRRGPGDRHQCGIAPVSADERNDALRESDEEREDQREVAKLGDHFVSFSVDIAFALRALSNATPASGGM